MSGRNVLVALDDSEAAERVLAEAVVLARAFGGELRLLHVAAPDPSFVGYEAGPQPVRDQRAQELRAEHRALQEKAEALRAEGLDAHAMLVEGITAETIVTEAERCACDWIVMGSHGRGVLARTLLGSVSQEVVRRADRPVVVVPIRAASESP